jgi:tetratricopeptide (TPR) repeat protein
MRKSLVLIILLFSSALRAADFAFLPAQTGAQKEFKAMLEKGNAKQALLAWPQAFQGSMFANSENGLALHAYLLSQNGLPVSSIKILVRQTNTKNISPVILELWKPVLDAYISEFPQGMMINASWTKLFSTDPNPITKLKEIKLSFAKLEKLSNDDPKKIKGLWAITTAAPQFGDTASALKALDLIKNSKQTLIPPDQLELASARVFYQKGDLDEALKHYANIPKGSDFWLETIEEKSWTYLRKNNPEKAIGEITTALSQPFEALTGPESYFLSELISLKICDYPKILKTAQLFKERHKERLTELSKLATLGSNKGVVQAMADLEHKGLSQVAVGANIKYMPRNFLRDREFLSHMRYRIDLLSENTKGAKLLSSLAAIGGDSALERVLSENQSEADHARFASLLRLKKLAEIDLVEYKQIINKLHIVEAEVIERLYVDERLKGKRKDLVKSKDEKGTLTFPYSDEVWMDELDHYRADIKDCPQLPSVKGASL